jgi:hypothetical protein
LTADQEAILTSTGWRKMSIPFCYQRLSGKIESILAWSVDAGKWFRINYVGGEQRGRHASSDPIEAAEGALR